jgi:hypothetical protein
VDLSRFTMDAYLRIVTYKTAFYTFYLPVACGMVLAGKAQHEALALANDICIEMGRYFQVGPGGWLAGGGGQARLPGAQGGADRPRLKVRRTALPANGLQPAASAAPRASPPPPAATLGSARPSALSPRTTRTHPRP